MSEAAETIEGVVEYDTMENAEADRYSINGRSVAYLLERYKGQRVCVTIEVAEMSNRAGEGQP